MAIHAFSDEQARAAINLAQRYDVWMEAKRALHALAYDLRIKTVGGRAYLYEIADRSGNGRSLGPLTDALQAKFDTYRAEKEMWQDRVAQSGAALAESCRLYRALKMPMLASEAGAILRQADQLRMLGSALLVVGTNALPAYALEARGFLIGAPDETDDFDLAWSALENEDAGPQLWSLLKSVDSTYTVNTKRSFQARNARAYEVEILAAPSRAASMSRTDRPKPVPLPEQEWLLNGSRVDHVVVCRDGSPARIVAPDPRWFALQKLWMSAQAKRNPLKRPKDRKQAMVLLAAITQTMPQFPTDANFVAELPVDLGPCWQFWIDNRPADVAVPWV